MQRYLDRRWRAAIKTRRDYINHPKPTGYRAYHLVVIRHDVPVEVQLRTRLQQAWAEAVEFAEIRTGALLKDGQGDADLLEAMCVLSEGMAYADRGDDVPAILQDEIAHRVDIYRDILGVQ